MFHYQGCSLLLYPSSTICMIIKLEQHAAPEYTPYGPRRQKTDLRGFDKVIFKSVSSVTETS